MDPEKMRELGKRIRMLVKLTGLTTKELASYLRVSEHAINNWVYGRGNPLIFIRKMRELFVRITFGDIIGLPEDAGRMARVFAYVESGDEKLILDGLQFPDSEQEDQ